MDLDEILSDDSDRVCLRKMYCYRRAYKYKTEFSNKNICILNFASAKNPCGGFLRGSMA